MNTAIATTIEIKYSQNCKHSFSNPCVLTMSITNTKPCHLCSGIVVSFIDDRGLEDQYHCTPRCVELAEWREANE